MAKKNKKKPVRPWCWYCERDFEDEKVLISHQRAKHFKCTRCSKKLNTAGGMRVHVVQVHKETINAVPNAMPGRETVDLEIYGMEGIPEEDMVAYMAKQDALDNPVSKRAKVATSSLEFSEEDLQSQLAAHKAMMQQTASPAAAGAPAMPMPPMIPGVPPPGVPAAGPPGFPAQPPGMPGPPGIPGADMRPPPPGQGPFPGQYYPGMPPAAASIMPAAYSQFYQPRPPQPHGIPPPHPGMSHPGAPPQQFPPYGNQMPPGAWPPHAPQGPPGSHAPPGAPPHMPPHHPGFAPPPRFMGGPPPPGFAPPGMPPHIPYGAPPRPGMPLHFPPGPPGAPMGSAPPRPVMPASFPSSGPPPGIPHSQVHGLKHTSHITSSPDPTTLAAATTTTTSTSSTTTIAAPTTASAPIVSSGATTTSVPTPVIAADASKSAANAKKEGVLVYSKNDVSVEEVRAGLERYRFRPQVESAA